MYNFRNGEFSFIPISNAIKSFEKHLLRSSRFSTLILIAPIFVASRSVFLEINQKISQIGARMLLVVAGKIAFLFMFTTAIGLTL